MNFGDTVVLERLLNIALSHLGAINYCRRVSVRMAYWKPCAVARPYPFFQPSSTVYYIASPGAIPIDNAEGTKKKRCRPARRLEEWWGMFLELAGLALWIHWECRLDAVRMYYFIGWSACEIRDPDGEQFSLLHTFLYDFKFHFVRYAWGVQ